MSTPALKLPATLEKFVASQVRQGTYRSREAAIVAAVAGEKRRTEQRKWLHAQIEQGANAESAGVLDVESIIRRGSARVASRKRRRNS